MPRSPNKEESQMRHKRQAPWIMQAPYRALYDDEGPSYDSYEGSRESGSQESEYESDSEPEGQMGPSSRGMGFGGGGGGPKYNDSLTC